MIKGKRSISRVSEVLSDVRHAEYQNVNTRVSEYLLKYGQGKIDVMPTDNRPEVTDDRSVDQMLDDETPEFDISSDELDVLLEFQKNADKFEQARLAIESSEKDKTAFENAMKVLNDPNSSDEAKRDSYRILDKLKQQGKVTFN